MVTQNGYTKCIKMSYPTKMLIVIQKNTKNAMGWHASKIVQMMMRLKKWKKTSANQKYNNNNSSIPRAHGVTT